MIRLSYIDEEYIFTGDTYPVKDKIDGLGFVWARLKRHWHTSILSMDKLDKIKQTFEDITIDDSVIDGIKYRQHHNYRERVLLKEQFPKLLDFQLDGIMFGKDRDVLIADEMGLGKTVQSVILSNMYKLPVLVVTPKSVLQQWRNEIRTWIGEGSHIVDGTNREEQYFSTRWSLVNYEKLMRDHEGIKYPEKWILVCDEVSKLKNYKTKIYKCMQQITKKANRIIFLTGTPIENRLEDFFNMGRLIHPGFIQFNNFRDEYCVLEKVKIKATRKNLWMAKREDRHGTYIEIPVVKGYKNLEDFVRRISGFCIRRRFKDVMDQLPELITQTRIVSLSTAQKRAYNKIIKEMKSAGKKKFEVIQLLRLVADDLRLFRESKSEFVDKLDLRYSDDVGNKIKELQTILEESSGKVVIFTQFARMAHLLYDAISDSVVVVGGISDKEKTSKIEDFRNNKRILISTDALAYGMNLQFATTLINFDLPWNPAILDQRVHRCYGRIGGEDSYLVVNMFSDDIEDRIYEVIEKKRDLFSKVVDGTVIENDSIRQTIISKFLERRK